MFYRGKLEYVRSTQPLPGTNAAVIYLLSTNDGQGELLFTSHPQAQEWAKNNGYEYVRDKDRS